LNVSAFIDICLRVARPSTFDLDPAVLFQQIWNDGRDEEPKIRFSPYCVWAGQIVLGFNAPSDRQFADTKQSDRPEAHRESDLVIESAIRVPNEILGLTVNSLVFMPYRKRRHHGWELSELTGRQRSIDRSPKKTARGELKAPVAIDPKALPFRFTHRVRHDRQGGVSQRAAV